MLSRFRDKISYKIDLTAFGRHSDHPPAWVLNYLLRARRRRSSSSRWDSWGGWAFHHDSGSEESNRRPSIPSGAIRRRTRNCYCQGTVYYISINKSLYNCKIRYSCARQSGQAYLHGYTAKLENVEFRFAPQ